MTRKPIFTIGHSNHSIERFIALLKQHKVEVVADVRSSPFSRHNPQFNRPELKKRLNDNGVKYLFLGKELGARSENPLDYENGRVSYKRLAGNPLFQSAIDRLLTGAEEIRIALMCAEREPLECHRTLLVAEALAGRGIKVLHILPSGELESHEAALKRLVVEVRPSPPDLFEPERDLLSEALRIREQQIAYVRRGVNA